MTESVPAARPGRAVSVPALAGLAALVTGAAVLGVLHVLPSSAGVDPVRDTISEYVYGPDRWLFHTAVVLVALGSACAFATMVGRALVRPVSAATVFAALWVAGLVAVVVFPKTDWSVGPSLAGTIHRYASVVAFASLPLAVWSAAGAVYPTAARPRRTARLLALASLAWLGIVAGAVVVMLFGGEPWWRSIPLGLVERLLAATEVLAIGSLLPGLLRVDDLTSSEADPLVPC
ncbi:hypothetical protein B1813_03815 [Saccharomonospora piscinae]|uniref:DUF998 domain-containing protein n=1 Tax=Saccharomonospora piscinae TaxID=687388 RepID=A0A1V9A9H1_SACPI|nr:DUF998 domain-containing protein [Saccharomonospora piscinae]OQO93676.1 hypothetical protein B1813_03815 [Saccharomonospora piscinae]TLW94836.1 DUF998 domain-containing protein [Saccharomonospora piscinae]